ncbi:hypothetical protein ACFXG4_42305 [Nocardia sp. NPDC059246]|uniref:hypothetical protein n=1 Tax=Nocardia sp. NPDC059246 TaxID=3346789 RepID=UPI0036A2759B
MTGGAPEDDAHRTRAFSRFHVRGIEILQMSQDHGPTGSEMNAHWHIEVFEHLAVVALTMSMLRQTNTRSPQPTQRGLTRRKDSQFEPTA